MKGKGLDEFFWDDNKQPKQKSYAMNEYSVGVLCRYR